MNIVQINNLRITNVTENILLIHQIKPPFYFSCCDGLIILPKKGRNTNSIVLDLNIEPNLIEQVNEYYGPVSHYICTHGHMDHMAHVYYWEKLGIKIHAPFPEHEYLMHLDKFYAGFGFNEQLSFSVVKKFAELNGYNSCKEVHPFNPGDFLKFENVEIETISFKGHSKGHVGLMIPQERILHISCLGFDQIEPGIEGFGPWYGFQECSIEQYLKDIDLAETIFLERADYLTSSHSYIIKNPDTTPFRYMREKIEKNQKVIDQAIKSLKLNDNSQFIIESLLELDLFFPKKKMKDFLRKIYRYWESGIIRKHIERSKYYH
jgi:glyoxylase-like metal-dependent hydrolase (beta-lactamase superfamily II)